MTNKLTALFACLLLAFAFTAHADTKYTITLSSAYIKLNPGGTQKVTYAVTPKNLTEHTVTWASENPYVASVSEKGVITAHAAGSTQISCTIETGAVRYVTVAVTGNPVRSLAISDRDIELEVGRSAQLEYTIDETADDKRVKWSSSDQSVAKVDSKGVVTAVSGGTAVITLTAVNGLTATADIYVPSDVKKIEIKPSDVNVSLGASVTLDAYVYPGNAKNRELVWASSDESIAIVDQNGTVTGITEGKCLVKAQSSNGTHAFANITVAKLPQSLRFADDIIVLTKANRFAQTDVISYPADTQGCHLNYESSNKNIVSVSSGGYLTANNYGVATITATAINGISASCTVYVCDPPTSVKFENSSYTIELESEGAQTSLRFGPENSWETGITYTIDDKNVATVNESGFVSPINPGICTLTALLPSGLAANTKITVYENATSLFLKSEHIYLNAGEVQPLKVFTNSGNIYTSTLNASSDSPGVAFYSDGYIIAKSEGNALITLRALAGNLSCSLAVTVSPSAYSMTQAVALTFDNGPSENTQAILDILKKYDINATFFLLGKSIEKYPAQAALFAETAHDIGNHTYSNISMNPDFMSEVASQLEKTDKLITGTVGHKASYLRAPDARLSESLIASFLDTRRYIGRGIDLGDLTLDADSIVKNALDSCYNTAVLTLHDSGENTAEALEKLIPELLMRGYRFVTITELIEITGNTDGVFSTAR